MVNPNKLVRGITAGVYLFCLGGTISQLSPTLFFIVVILQLVVIGFWLGWEINHYLKDEDKKIKGH